MPTGMPYVEPAAATAPAPARLGRYTLLDKLGEGAMGVVWRAHDPLLDRSVALKTFRAPAGAAAASLRLRHEAQAAARLSHPGIVAVHEYGEDGAQSFIAMEYVRGRALLGALAQRQPLPIDDVLCLMVQLLVALQCAHEQGVWHRDIKPSNLMITHEGRLKITDFGVARIEHQGATAPARERGIIGSPGYIAPECYRRDAVVDQRADLYACGVLLFELLTGARPYRGSPDVVMFKTLNLPVPPLAVPGDAQFVALSRFAHVVQRALAKSPDQRYASALEMRRALTLAAEGAVPHALSAPALRLLLQASANDESALPVLRDVVSEMPKRPADEAAAALSPQLLRHAQRLLAHQIGPMAALLVRRAAAGAATRERFIARLVSLAAEGAERDALFAALTKLGR
jgi:serine/threonine-protein kinase